LGQKQTYAMQKGMFALALIADMDWRPPLVNSTL
jgi:hypothetical protein